MAATRPDAEVLARDALEWLLRRAREQGPALAWAGRTDDDELDPTLYGGTAGIVLALLEGYRHFGDARYAEAASRGAQTVAAAVAEEWELPSLAFGVAGMALALRAVYDMLGDHRAGQATAGALDLLRRRFDGQRWAGHFELLKGNAGIALCAALAGDLDLAVLAVTPYLSTAEPTPGGVHWEARTGLPARFHHISHGTLGIVYALAAVGHAACRDDLIDLALAGAADVVSRNEAGPGGFLVPHSDPQHRPEVIERYSYGWCHGPAGDAQVFRLLAQVTGDPAWTALASRCWHTVTRSGVPQRLRPGFWDNNGRCCGTAGVLALACDRQAEDGDGLAFADILVGDLAARATLDAGGARWSNYEHRASPAALSPRMGWAMGNAGIVRELLRYARIRAGQAPDYAVAWPGQPLVARLRAGVQGGYAGDRFAEGGAEFGRLEHLGLGAEREHVEHRDVGRVDPHPGLDPVLPPRDHVRATADPDALGPAEQGGEAAAAWRQPDPRPLDRRTTGAFAPARGSGAGRDRKIAAVAIDQLEPAQAAADRVHRDPRGAERLDIAQHGARRHLKLGG
jgi:hypothetical protein